jgi:hypothetical protein
MAGDDYQIGSDGEDDGAPAARRGATNSLTNVGRRLLAARVGRVPMSGIIGAVALLALIGGAYIAGSPAGSGGGSRLAAYDNAGGAPVVTGPGKDLSGSMTDGYAAPTAGPAAVPGAAVDTPKQIVKTGSMSVEVSDLDKAVGQAQSAIIGLGGEVSQSSQSGEKDSAVASLVYRVPADKFDAAQAAIRGLAARVISVQTNTNDVTVQVVDLEARLANLRATESALQSIMARATLIADVLAVEQQLSNTQGQIEELTAQRDYLKNQAAMSTLAVTFSLPGKTVTTQAAQGWDLGAQIDDAAAALVRIGQGLATLAVWAVVVVLPVLIGLGLLLGVVWILRRVFGRRRGASVQA